MFEARNGITSDTITAEEFEHAADRQSVALRLTCLGCSADAMFRRQSITAVKRRSEHGMWSRTAATLRAAPATPSIGRSKRPSRELQPRTWSRSARPSTEALRQWVLASSMIPTLPQPSREGAAVTPCLVKRLPSIPTQGLRAILRSLIRDPRYCTSSKQLVLPGRYKGYSHLVRQVCVPTLDVTPEHVKPARRRLYWGEIRWAATGSYRLNTERWVTLIVQVPPDAMVDLTTTYRLDDVENLIGARFIA